jgi:hypothetical protein
MSPKQLCFGLLAAGLILSGCATADSESAADSDVDTSFPARSVSYKTYRFDSYERKRAANAFRVLKAEMLFELVIDRQGNVQRIHAVKSRLAEAESSRFKALVAQMKFSTAESDDPFPYRAMFFPLQLTTSLIER